MKYVALLAALLLSACTTNINDTDVEKEALSLSQVQKMTAANDTSTLLIDARTPQDYNAGHIPGAVNVTVAQISGVDGDIDPRIARYSKLIVYGNDPGSIPAMALGKRLIASGYKGVRYYPEGMMGWKAAGLPIETKTPPAPTVLSPSEVGQGSGDKPK